MIVQVKVGDNLIAIKIKILRKIINARFLTIRTEIPKQRQIKHRQKKKSNIKQ